MVWALLLFLHVLQAYYITSSSLPSQRLPSRGPFGAGGLSAWLFASSSSSSSSSTSGGGAGTDCDPVENRGGAQLRSFWGGTRRFGGYLLGSAGRAAGTRLTAKRERVHISRFDRVSRKARSGPGRVLVAEAPSLCKALWN